MSEARSTDTVDDAGQRGRQSHGVVSLAVLFAAVFAIPALEAAGYERASAGVAAAVVLVGAVFLTRRVCEFVATS
ncbi:hypothetical protein [Halobacterium rubrum]|uniref:hypothetical protein n=1 Tax=Halobacterium TaxID=2239 RepID=UPI001F36F080|nr:MULTISPECIES: hypothetical protein [Halobacterium]MDH5021762.1 hypothetical protein [Halobacterium rubrum]